MSESGATTAVRVSISGQVQGVAFRACAQQEAERLGVAGWVRNEVDGSVAAHLEGSPEAVEQMVAWCRHGPSGADVDDVERRDADPAHATSFEVHA